MRQAAGGVAGVMPLALATGLFRSVCTMRAPDGAFDESGAPSGAYVDVTGLVNIPCTSAPLSELRIEATEMKTLAEIESFAPRHVLLGGYFPTLENGITKGWIAVIDGVAWDAMGAESDSQHVMTRVFIRASAI